MQGDIPELAGLAGLTGRHRAVEMVQVAEVAAALVLRNVLQHLVVVIGNTEPVLGVAEELEFKDKVQVARGAAALAAAAVPAVAEVRRAGLEAQAVHLPVVLVRVGMVLPMVAVAVVVAKQFNINFLVTVYKGIGLDPAYSEGKVQFVLFGPGILAHSHQLA